MKLTLFISLLVTISLVAAKQPSVVIFLSDDQGWGDFSHTGNPILKTPNIDSLAKDGVFLKHFYVQPVCSPTRAEMLTGRWFSRLGVYSTSRGGERMNAGEKTIADYFKAAGYATGAFGKWHNGTQWPYHPNARGFDEFYGFASGHWGFYFSPMLEHNSEIVKGKGYVIDDFTTKAIEFMETNKEKPFLCYLPYCTPHSPMQVPDEYWERFKDKKVEQKNQVEAAVDHTRAALAMVENIDWNVGRVLKALDRLKLAEDTIVIYFNDNGPNGARWNDGLRGIKGSTDEGGVRSPLFVRYPAKFKKGHVVPEISGAVDLLPTLADMCGVELKGGKLLDGVSLKPLLMGEKVDWRSRYIFNKWGRGGTSVRSQTHRLDGKGRLYNMTKDPGQTTDISKDEPELAKELITAREKWLKDVTIPKQERPFIVGYSGSKLTHLPARDAGHTKGIKRSSVHPNCSYLLNWTNTEDKITFDVEVAGGYYKPTIYYTCREEDVGCQLVLSCGNARFATTISEAHDPPIQGKKENKVYKRESFVKDFKPHAMGVINLPDGKGQLELKATKIPGEQAIEFRLLVLEKVN